MGDRWTWAGIVLAALGMSVGAIGLWLDPNGFLGNGVAEVAGVFVSLGLALVVIEARFIRRDKAQEELLRRVIARTSASVHQLAYGAAFQIADVLAPTIAPPVRLWEGFVEDDWGTDNFTDKMTEVFTAAEEARENSENELTPEVYRLVLKIADGVAESVGRQVPSDFVSRDELTGVLARTDGLRRWRATSARFARGDDGTGQMYRYAGQIGKFCIAISREAKVRSAEAE